MARGTSATLAVLSLLGTSLLMNAPPASGAGRTPDRRAVWARQYDGRARGADTGSDVAVNADGTLVFVAGTSDRRSGTRDFVIIAYDRPTGIPVWSARFNGTRRGDLGAAVVKASPVGSSAFVTGTGSGGFVTVAFDGATGTQLWSTQSPGTGTAHDMAVSPDGTRVFVTGGDIQDHTVAYDAATGAQLWAASAYGFWQTSSSTSIAVSPDGAMVYITGWTYVSFFADGRLVAAYGAAHGGHAWALGGEGSGEDGTSIAVSPDGATLYVAGYLYAEALTADTGDVLWAVGGYPEGPKVLVGVSPDGSTVYTVRMKNSNYSIVALVAASGARSWIVHPGGPATQSPVDLAVGPDGSAIYVTGTSSSGAGWSRMATAAFDAATGAGLWRSLSPVASSGATDSAAAVAVSPDGMDVFVTGTHFDTPTNPNFGTIAYQS